MVAMSLHAFIWDLGMPLKFECYLISCVLYIVLFGDLFCAIKFWGNLFCKTLIIWVVDEEIYSHKFPHLFINLFFDILQLFNFFIIKLYEKEKTYNLPKYMTYGC